MILRCFIPEPLQNPLNGSLSHAHWSKKSRWARTRRESAQMYLLQALGRARLDPVTPKAVTFHAFVFNLFDSDGLQAALKPTRDALKHRVIDDDRPSAGHTFTYEQEISRGKGAERGVEIIVEPLTP